ncbi:F-actin-monooxygenase Mical-like isoform X2 [Ptychodera flava]|uniref:F-actin-monooxygenase Mical-like isoform X2 n=1 Tax=Ptychodera flava TaxID=63121 RepID=UPI003969C5DC
MQPKEEEPDYSTCLFDQFMHANTFRTIISAFTDLCEFLEVKPNDFKSCYPYLKNRLTSWKAKTLWAKLDKKAKHKDYKGGKACTNTKVLIIGAGPCGLRSAIDASLLGAKVVVVEKRDRFSRNNVLHLWPYVIEDLRSLGAKKFYGKFCAGSIDHISIRQLQCMLLKVSLLFGVEVHGNTAFEGLIEPPENQEEERIGWRAHISPPNHPIADYEFDVLIGADGKRNTLGGFKRKEFRGKLAIAITANFVNRHTKAETRVEEISGVAYIFNQKFFKDLKAQTRIDLENIVYYKDETHYFVMTAKKSSLLEKGVLLQDYAEAEQLLCGENISQEALLNYAREAADFSTNQKLPRLDFALNHYGLPDVAMFDFTSMYAAENAARVVERNNSQLLVGLVGDSLLEPFWPTGSGCARGFLGCADASWMIRSWASGRYSPLEVLAERESIYRLLAQTTPENLNKDLHQYSVDPKTRYPNLNTAAVEPASCILLYDNGKDVICEEMLIEKSRPKLQRKMSVIRTSKLLQWCKMATENYSDVSVENMTSSWKSGLALCAIIHRFRPGLIDFHSLKQEDIASNNQLAFDVAEKEFGIMPVMTGIEMASVEEPDKLTMVAYLSQFYEALKEELPVQSSAENRLPEEEFIPGHKSPGHRASLLAKLQKKFHKKSLRREDGEEKENQKRRSLSGSKRRGKDQIDLGKKFEDLNSEKQKDWDKKEDLDVGVRGANRVSAMADSLFAQFQEIAGVKPSSGDPVNRPSFVFGASEASRINKMAEQLYQQFEDIADSQQLSESGQGGPAGNSSAQIQQMTQQLREQFQDMTEMREQYRRASEMIADDQMEEVKDFQQVEQMRELLEQQFKEMAGLRSFDKPNEKPKINVSTQNQIKKLAGDLDEQFKAVAKLAPRSSLSSMPAPPSPQQKGKIKELAEDLHQKFMAFAAVQEPDIVLDEHKTQGQVQALSDALFSQLQEASTAKREYLMRLSSTSSERVNRMTEKLYERSQRATQEKELQVPTQTSVSTKAQQLHAKFQELAGVKTTFKEPPKSISSTAKKPVNTGALSRRQVRDMAEQVLNKFQDDESSKQGTKISATEGPTTEVKVMTYQLLAKVEEMAAQNQKSEPKQINQIEKGQLKQTTERFMSSVQEGQRSVEKKQVTTGVGSIYDMLMARFQPVEDGKDKDARGGSQEEEAVNELNMVDRILFSKFRDMAGLKSTRAEEQPQQKQKTSWWGSQQPKSKQYSGATGGSDFCFFCGKRVYVMERLSAEGLFFHRGCFKCHYCQTTLRIGNYAYHLPPNENKQESRFFCRPHFKYSKLSDGGPRKRRIEEAKDTTTIVQAEPVKVIPERPTSPVVDEPMEKKYKTTPDVTDRDSAPTPERIFLDSTLDRSMGVLLTEEEVASYNYGDSSAMDEDYESSSDDYEDDDTEDEYSEGSDYDPIQIPEKYLLKKPVLLDPPAGESEGEESEDDDESWDESEEEELDYESDDEDMSEEELLPVEEKANDLQWKEPTKQEIDVVEEAELEDAKDKEKTEPEAAGAAEVKGEAADDKNESPEERYDHKAQVASITSLKLQWLTQPEPPDHSQWGRRSLPKPTPPKLVFPEEEKPPPVPPLPSQEDLAKANIIDAEDSESKKEADSKGKEETGDAAVKEKGKEEQSYEGHRNKQQEDSDSDGEILVPTFDTTTFKTKLEIEEGEIEASEESEGEFLVEVGTKTGVDFVDGSVTKDDEGESSGLDRTSSLDGSGSLDMVEEEFVSLEWKDAESVARELESQQVDKDGVLGEAFEENLAEIYGETLKNLDEEGSDSAVKDERAQVSSESSREPSVDSDELREKVDSVPSEGEGSVEEGHIDVNLEQPESTNLQDNSREKVDYVEDDLADVYGDTLARLEAKGETPVEEKNIAEIFTFEKVHVDDVEEGEVLEEHFDLERQTPRTNYARKNLVTQEEMLSGGALQPGEAPTEISFIDDVDTDSPVEEEKPSPAPLARDEEFSDSDVEEGEILIESGSTHGKDSDILDSIERDDNESAGVAADNRNEVKAVNDVAHLRVADNFDNTPQKTPELNLDITNVTRRAKPKLLQLEKTDIENLGPATESPRSPGASSTASSTLETDTLKSYQEELMNISKLDNLQDSLQIDSSLPPEKDVPRSGEASEINESQRSVEDIDVAFKTINEAVTKDTSTDLTDVSFETADSSLRYDDSFLDGLDKTSRTSTMSSKPDSTFSRDSIDSINADLHISIMSSDSESGDSAKATLEMYARELEYQSIRDEGDDIVAASPREEVKPLPGMTPKAKENDSITEVDSVQRNSKTSEDKNEAQVPKSKKEMKPPPLKMSQPPKHSVSKGKVYTTFDESFNDIPAVDKVEDRVSQEKSGVVQKTPAKVPVKRGNKEKVKGKAKKYVVPDDGIWDEEFYTPMTTVTKNTFSAKGDSDYKGTAKAKAQDKKKAVEASASPSLKYRPLPVPQGQKDTKPVPQKGSASPRLYKGKKDDKKTNGTTSPKVSTTPKGSREPSPSVTAGNGKVVFNKSGKAKKSEKEKEDRMEQKPPKSPQKSPKERKGKKPLSKNREELKKINLDEKSKTPTKAKVAASSLDDSAKSKKSSKKKTDEMPMGEIRSAKKQTPVKKAPTKAPLAKLDLSDDLLSDGDLTPVESVVKPKASAGTPRPLPPRPSSLSATDSIRGVVVDDLSSDTSEDELSAVTPTESHSSDKKKKSKRKSLAKKLKDKSSAKFTEEELNEKLTKKVQKAARKQHRQQELRRLRMAQEIQRHLQEVEVKQRMLEDRGVELEKSFRGESSDEKDDEGTLMQEWFSLINEKNSLVRFEQELTIQAKELELEDRHSRLQQELRERMAIDDTKKTKEDQDHEKKLLEEMLEVVEQRDKLVVLLEEERLKEKEEDKDVETMMLKKGFLVASS